MSALDQLLKEILRREQETSYICGLVRAVNDPAPQHNIASKHPTKETGLLVVETRKRSLIWDADALQMIKDDLEVKPRVRLKKRQSAPKMATRMKANLLRQNKQRRG
jgi:hypothetical protein